VLCALTCLGRGAAGLFAALLLVLLGLAPPIHAIGPTLAPESPPIYAGPTDDASPVVLVFLAPYRAHGPPVGVVVVVLVSRHGAPRLVGFVTCNARHSAWAILYAYCGGDPVNRSDPSGLAWHSVTDGVWRWEDDGDGIRPPSLGDGRYETPEDGMQVQSYGSSIHYAYRTRAAFDAWHMPIVDQQQAGADALWAQEKAARAAQRLANRAVARLYNPTTSQFEFFTDAGEADARAAELTTALSAQAGAANERARMLSGVRITAFSDDEWVGIQQSWKRDEALRERAFMGAKIGIGLALGPELIVLKAMAWAKGGAAVARGVNAAGDAGRAVEEVATGGRTVKWRWGNDGITGSIGSREADEAYAAIRASTKDVDAIVRYQRLSDRSRERLGRIKEYLFNNREFQADPEIASAWHRLRTGAGSPADMTLLKHEVVEMYSKAKNGLSHEEAHRRANDLFNWQRLIDGP